MRVKRFDLVVRRISIRLLLVFSLLFSTFPGPGFANYEDTLDQKDKIEVFDKVWKLINDRYYDPGMNGVDWRNVRERYQPLISETRSDIEYYDVIKKMVGEMNDAHTRFLSPSEARQRRARKGTTAGILLTRINGETFVEKVLPGATGELAKVKPGMKVLTVDGAAIEAKFESVKKNLGGSSSDRALEILTYRRILRGEPGSTVKIELLDERAMRIEVNLVRRTVSESSEAIAEVLPSGLGYLLVTSFKSPISGKFKRALAKLKDTPALIVDLRYNGGGSINEVLTTAGTFLDRKYSFGKFLKRKGSSRQMLKKFSAGSNGGQLYSKPLIILTSKYSASGSELFASSLQELGRAKVVGTQTCGCVLGISRRYKLRGGGELHISDIGFVSAKGMVYEKVGVTPDIVVNPSVSDLRSGFDRGLTEAEIVFRDIAAEQ